MPSSILPMDAASPRPFWSVMIPSYNCAQYLKQTLITVLAQDPGRGKMQIEVVDDGSSDDPESVIRSIGKGRVDFYRNPKNLGPIGNFNQCIRRSKGEWVHILHGDDYVQQNFYQRLEETITGYPDVNFIAVRCYVHDEFVGTASPSPRVPSIERPGTNPAALFYTNPLRTPGAVIRRKFYEEHGGFNENLIHVADWEMWIRAIAKGKGMMLNELLADYRHFPGNHTSLLMRTGRNALDFLILADVLKKDFPGFNSGKLRRIACNLLDSQHKKYIGLGDHEAAEANFEMWKKNKKPIDPFFKFAGGIKLRLHNWMNEKRRAV